MPQQELSQLCSLRMYPTEKALALKLAKYSAIRGRGRLFAKYMAKDVESIRKTGKSILANS